MQICVSGRLSAVNAFIHFVKKRQIYVPECPTYDFCVYFSGVNVKRRQELTNKYVLSYEKDN